MLPKAERAVLNRALEKYGSEQAEPILVGGHDKLKAALRLMTAFRLKIEQPGEAGVAAIYTRWVESVQVRGENQDVYVTFSPRFKRLWLQAKNRMLDYVAQNPGNTGLRSKYAICLYGWAKKYVTVGKKRISLEQLRRVLGLESVKDEAGNVIRESPLSLWANFRQRALDVAITEINRTSDLRIEIESVQKSNRRINGLSFSIKGQTIAKSASSES
jgi:plasmid replication initiation protein